MLASRTINGTDESGMIIYYKTASGKWINALTGQNITVPTTFEVEVTDLVKEGNITLTNPNYETQELDKGDIYPSTYVIGDYIYTRNSNKKYNYDGKLTTQRIMLASKTLKSDKEEDMIIYYKTARGIWIDALTGHEVTPTQKLNISTVDLINQKNDNMEVYLSSGTVFNQKIKQLAGNANATYETNDVKITKVKKAESINLSNLSSNNIISTDESDVPLYVWYDNGTIYYYPLHYFDNVKIYLNSLSNFMFYNLSKVTEIDISNFDTSKATNMSCMFQSCGSITTAWARTSADAARFNASSYKPTTFTFVVKP